MLFTLTLGRQVKMKRIPEYYAGKVVLLTGGLGFVGKLLIEKLLRSCPDVAAIYVPIRANRGMQPEERWREATSIEIFDRLKKERPGILDKVIVLPGNASEANLGLSPEHLEMVINNVNIIFHGAATINFNALLLECIKGNLLSTYTLAELARKIKNLDCFVYISTEFSNSDEHLSDLKEKIYPSKYNWRDLLDLSERDPETLSFISQKMIGNHPVHYTFSKGLAESVMNDYSSDYPVVVIRPSLIIATHKEPFPGWTDKLNSHSSSILGITTGVIKVHLHSTKAEIEAVPADMVVKTCISSAWDVGMRAIKKGIQVYSVTFGKRLPYSSKDIMKTLNDNYKLFATQFRIWHPILITTQSILLFRILVLLFHVLPAFLIDLLLRIQGKQFSLLQLYKKITFLFFCNMSYLGKTMYFEYPELEKMEKRIPVEDAPDFETHTDKFDFFDVTLINFRGYRRYILKEDMSEEAENRAVLKARIFKVIHYVTCGLIGGLILHTIVL